MKKIIKEIIQENFSELRQNERATQTYIIIKFQNILDTEEDPKTSERKNKTCTKN